MANESKYVDWDGLVYYDSKIKSYVEDKISAVSAECVTKEDLKNIDKEISAILVDVKELQTKMSDAEQEIQRNIEDIQIIEEDIKDINQAIADIRVDVENKLDESAMEYLATKKYVDLTVENATKVDLTNYYTKAETDAKIPSVEGLASEEFVVTKIAEAELSGKDVDLSAYYTKTEVDSKFTTKEELTEHLDDFSGLLGELNGAFTLVEASVNDVRQDVNTLQVSVDAIQTAGYVTYDGLEKSGYATRSYVDTTAEAAAWAVKMETGVWLNNANAEIDALKDRCDDLSGQTLSNYVKIEELQEEVKSLKNNSNNYVTQEVVESLVVETIQDKIENDELEITAEKINYGSF